MGKFKDLFVEEVKEQDDCGVQFEEEQDVEVNFDVGTENIIEDIYEKNELSDRGKSIYKIEDLINSLPEEMVTETKKNTVKSTLGVFGLTVQEVCDDGEKRKNVLKHVFAEINDENVKVIDQASTRIEKLKIEIQEKQKLIEECNQKIDSTYTGISEEINKIDRLISFVGGNEE